MTDRAAMAPEMNLLPSTMKWQSRTKMPQILKFHAWAGSRRAEAAARSRRMEVEGLNKYGAGRSRILEEIWGWKK